MKVNFDNPVEIKVISGETGEVTCHYEHNAISDDLLAMTSHIFITQLANSSSAPYCFILPDGTEWSGFTFDRMNPWAPYCISVSNFVDNSANTTWQARQGVGGYTAPTNTVTGKHKLFFQWSNLATDFQLRAIGLTGWQGQNGAGGNITEDVFGVTNVAPVVFVPQTLLVLPSAVLVHGRNGGSGTPDVLQVSYFLSIVGTS